MTATVDAIYEKGTLRLLSPLALPENSQVRVCIEPSASPDDAERAIWLKLSEKVLTEAWDNSEDEIFNDLLQR